MDKDGEDVSALIADFMHDTNGDVQRILNQGHLNAEPKEIVIEKFIKLLQGRKEKAIALELEMRRKGRQQVNAETYEITIPHAETVRATWNSALYTDEKDRSWFATGGQTRAGESIVQLITFDGRIIIGTAKKKVPVY